MSEYYDRCGGALFVVGGSKGGGILIVVSANWSLAFNDVIEFWDGKGEKYSHARTSSSNFCDGISDLRNSKAGHDSPRSHLSTSVLTRVGCDWSNCMLEFPLTRVEEARPLVVAASLAWWQRSTSQMARDGKSSQENLKSELVRTV